MSDPQHRHPAASRWEQGILNHLDAHIALEESALSKYEDLGARARDDYVKYLIGIVAEDEHRHHAMFRGLADSLRSEIELGAIEAPVPPVVESHDSAPLIEAAEHMLVAEGEDLKALRRLRRQLKPVKDTTLWSLLVEAMELDTKKHIKILEFIVDTARHPIP